MRHFSVSFLNNPAVDAIVLDSFMAQIAINFSSRRSSSGADDVGCTTLMNHVVAIMVHNAGGDGYELPNEYLLFREVCVCIINLTRSHQRDSE